MKLIIWNNKCSTKKLWRSFYWMDISFQLAYVGEKFYLDLRRVVLKVIFGYRLPYWNRPCWLPGLYNRVKNITDLTGKITPVLLDFRYIAPLNFRRITNGAFRWMLIAVQLTIQGLSSRRLSPYGQVGSATNRLSEVSFYGNWQP